MNIFHLSSSPRISALLLGDKHVVKMTLETAQIICTTRHFFSLPAPYRATHVNHPCVKWARETSANYAWLLDHFAALGTEYTHRFGKTHRSILTVVDRACPVPEGPLTPPPLCMPDQYHAETPVESYRNYYREAKRSCHRWTKRPIPHFIRETA